MNITEFYRNKIYPNLQYLNTSLDSIKYQRYALKLVQDSSPLSEKKYKKIMKIENGEFFYEYFNFCYMHNILSLIVYCTYHNCLPLICINEGKKDLIQWSWYFEEPFDTSRFSSSLPTVSCPKKFASYQPHFKDIYNADMISVWSSLYRQCVRLNSDTLNYIENEYKTIFSSYKKVLGVICRGTDYTTMKPSGHPVQPCVNEIIEHCQNHMKTSEYDAIYLATEERQIKEAFGAAFPGKILENKRKYYDDIYYSSQEISYIKDVHFDRENNNYWMGLEYLSSITLLSRCTSLIGSNCGGTMAAIFMNDHKYEYTHIFDLGLYP